MVEFYNEYFTSFFNLISRVSSQIKFQKIQWIAF